MKNNKTVISLTLIILFGALARILCCFWGYPFQLHPDEPTIVENAIDILSRGSYMPHVYNRPDHFEIKCCAVLFEIFSRIRFGGVSAAVSFDSHQMMFYVIARLFTAFWGIAMIPLTYMFTSKIMDRAKWIATAFVAFFPVFVQHSAYSTPDIPLTFFMLLGAYYAILYIEKPSTKTLIIMDVICALSITIKYTGAIYALWIAAVVIYKGVCDKDYKRIFVSAAISVGIVIAVTFAVAPNLYLEIQKTIDTLRFESRDQQLAADGLSNLGNFVYYFKVFFAKMGYEAVVPFAFGIYGLAVKEKKLLKTFGLGFIYWLSMSSLSLHWERWGIPTYIFMIVVVSVGIITIWDMFNVKPVRGIVIALGALIGCNLIVSTLLTVQGNTLKDARVAAREWCDAYGITADNAIYDDYTPFGLNGRDNNKWLLQVSEDGASLAEEIQYIIINMDMCDMYIADAANYPSEVAWYTYVMQNEEAIYEIDGSYGAHDDFCVTNIITAIRSIAEGFTKDACGHHIVIYRVK